jgi:hypothetical protein
MSPIEQAKALAACYRERADKMAGSPHSIAKYRETAAVLEQLIDAVQRP